MEQVRYDFKSDPKLQGLLEDCLVSQSTRHIVSSRAQIAQYPDIYQLYHLPFFGLATRLEAEAYLQIDIHDTWELRRFFELLNHLGKARPVIDIKTRLLLRMPEMAEGRSQEDADEIYEILADYRHCACCGTDSFFEDCMLCGECFDRLYYNWKNNTPGIMPIGNLRNRVHPYEWAKLNCPGVEYHGSWLSYSTSQSNT